MLVAAINTQLPLCSILQLDTIRRILENSRRRGTNMKMASQQGKKRLFIRFLSGDERVFLNT